MEDYSNRFDKNVRIIGHMAGVNPIHDPSPLHDDEVSFFDKWLPTYVDQTKHDPKAIDKFANLIITGQVDRFRENQNELYNKKKITEKLTKEQQDELIAEINLNVANYRTTQARNFQDKLLKYFKIDVTGRIKKDLEGIKEDHTSSYGDIHFVLPPIATGEPATGQVLREGIGLTKSDFAQGSFRVKHTTPSQDFVQGLNNVATNFNKEAATFLDSAKRVGIRAEAGSVVGLVEIFKMLDGDLALGWDRFGPEDLPGAENDISSWEIATGLFNFFGSDEEHKQESERLQRKFEQRWNQKYPRKYWEKRGYEIELSGIPDEVRKLSLLDVTNERDNWYDQVYDGIKSLSRYKNLNLNDSLAYDIGRLMGQEAPFMPLFMGTKLIQGAWTAAKWRFVKGVKGLTPQKLIDDFGLSDKQAKKIYRDYQLGSKAEVAALYAFQELDMVVGFSSAFAWAEKRDRDSRFQQNMIILKVKAPNMPYDERVKKARKISEQASFSPFNMGIGVLGAVLGRPFAMGKNIIQGRGRFGLVPIIYKSLDVLGLGDTKAIQDARKVSYLTAMGMRREAAVKARDDGNLDTEVARWDKSFSFGPLTKFFDMLHALPEKEKGVLKKMFEYNFDNLSKIAVFMREELGQNFHLSIDEVFSFGALGALKAKLNQQQPFVSRNFWKQIYQPQVEDIARRQQTIMEGITQFALHTKKLIKTDDAPPMIKEFYNHVSGIVDNMKATIDEDVSAINLSLAFQKNKVQTKVDDIRLGLQHSFGKLKNGMPAVGTLNSNSARRLTKDVFEGIREQARKATDNLYTNVNKNLETVFPADTFVSYIRNEVFNNPEIHRSILSALGAKQHGPSPSWHNKLIRAMQERSLDFPPTEEGVQQFKSAVLEGMEIDFKRAEGISGQLSADSPFFDFSKNLENALASTDNFRDKLQILKNAAGEVSTQSLDQLFPLEFTLREIKEIAETLGNQSWQKREVPAGYHLSQAKDKILELLDDADVLPNLSVEDKKLGADLLKARKVYKEVMQVWGRPPFKRMLQYNKDGGKLVSWESSVGNLFSDYGRIGENLEGISKLLKGIPYDIDNAGNFLYKPLDPGTVDNLTTVFKHYLHEGIMSGDISARHVSKILQELGEKTGFPSKTKGFFDKVFPDDTKKLLEQYVKTVDPTQPIRDANTHTIIDKLIENVKSLQKVRGEFIDKSWLNELVGKNKLNPNEIFGFFTETPVSQSVLRTGAAPKRRVEVFSDPSFLRIGDEGHLKAGPEVSGAVPMKRYRRLTETGEVWDSHYEILKKATNNWEGDEGQALKKIFTELLQEYILDQTIDVGTITSVFDFRKNAQFLNNQKLTDILEKTAQLREELFDPKVNEWLNTAGNAAAIHADILVKASDQMGNFSGGMIPQKMKLAAALSRLYAWQRGVVGMRWILGEAGIREMQLAQSKMMKEVLNNTDMTEVAMDMLRNEVPDIVKNKGIWSGQRWGKAVKALAYLSFTDPAKVAKIFTEDEASYFIKEGVLHEDTIERVLSVGKNPIRPKGISDKEWKRRSQILLRQKKEMAKLLTKTPAPDAIR